MVEASFSSSFCSDLDIEMLDVMDKMELDFNVKKVNTQRSRKGQLQVKTTTVSTKSPNCRENIHKSNKPNIINSPNNNIIVLTDSDVNSHSNVFINDQKNSGKDLDIKVPLTENSLKNHTLEKDKVFTSPGDELAGSWKLRKRKSVNLNDNDNIAWQTPKIASTPQTTQISRLGNVGTKSTVKRQNQLFKSLFTIESPMNISNISLSSPCLEGNKGSEIKGSKSSKNDIPKQGRESTERHCKKTIFKDAAHSFKENTSADKVIANTNKMGKNNNTFTGKMDQNKNNGKIVENNNTGKMVKNTNTDKMAEMISGNGEFNKHKKIGGKRKSDVDGKIIAW
jgi:hypothetical protein